MSKAIKTIIFDEQNIGRTIKSTKKHFSWVFELDGSTYTVDLFASKISGKKTIRINGNFIFEGKKQGKVFHKSIDIGAHNIIIIEIGKSYDLRIDGISFQILQKQQLFGTNVEDQSQNIMSDKLIPENQEEWEKAARLYKVILREGLTTAEREVLPIRLIKKSKEKVAIQKNDFDARFIFNTGGISPDLLDSGENKPRSLSSAKYDISPELFY